MRVGAEQQTEPTGRGPEVGDLTFILSAEYGRWQGWANRSRWYTWIWLWAEACRRKWVTIVWGASSCSTERTRLSAGTGPWKMTAINARPHSPCRFVPRHAAQGMQRKAVSARQSVRGSHLELERPGKP